MLGEGGLPQIFATDSDLYCSTLSSPTSSGEAANTFSQVRGLQALKVRVQQVVSEASGKYDGNARNEELRLVFLYCLLLYMDPDTGSLRKSTKALLMAAEEASKTLGGGMDDIVELVATRFVERAWNMNTPAASHNSTDNSAAPGSLPPFPPCSQEGMVASLQWLLDVPAGRRVLLEGKDGLLFGRSIAILSLLLEAAALPIQRYQDRASKAGSRRNTTVEVAAGLAGLKETKEAVLESEEDGERGGVGGMSIDSAIDCCSEIMKTAACLLSSAK